MYNVLFREGCIGRMRLKNRIVMAPMGNLADVDGGFSKRQIDYYAERAKGGAGLIVTGSLLLTSKFGGSFAGVFEGMQHVGRLTELAESVHRYGAKLALQFNLGGGRCGGNISASEVPTVANPEVLCRALTKEEIHFLVEQIGRSAALAQKAGADAILLHAYAGYLLDQFQSSEWNHRTDEYGGSLENRMRLTTELIQSIKKSCGRNYPVIVKFSVDHSTETGRKLPEGLEMCRMLEEAGADAIQVDTGSFQTRWNRCIPTVYDSDGYSLDMTEQVKQQVTIPVLGQNRLSQPELAAKAVEEGRFDFLVLGHALLADPEWPKKVKAGQIQEIRPCIGCNSCLLSVNSGKYYYCAVNPWLSHEKDPDYQLASAEVPKKILVIGGGPAGMTAAQTAAKAGHLVSLWEKSSELGGNMIAAGAPSFKGDVKRYVCYMQEQTMKSSIRVELNRKATVDAVAQGGYDRVIVATGARSKRLPVEGADRPHVMLSLEVLSGQRSIEGRVVVVGGGLVGCEVACSAAETASQVTILEFLPDILMTGEEARNNEIALRSLLKQRNLEVICGAGVTKITEDRIFYKKDGKVNEIPCDTVILATGFDSDNELAAELPEVGILVTTIGDATFPRKIGTSVREGLFAVLDME